MRWIVLCALLACGKGAAKEETYPPPSDEEGSATEQVAAPPNRFANDPDPCRRSCGHWMESFAIERRDKNGGQAISAPPGKHEMYFDMCVDACRAMPAGCQSMAAAKPDDAQIDACTAALHVARADVTKCLAAAGELGIANCLAGWAKVNAKSR